MTTNLYLRLNNLFPSDQDIVNVKKFKENKSFPASIDTPRKRAAFEKKYKDFNLSKDRRNLLYIPLNLQVVPKLYKKLILQKEYKNNFGSGTINFYKSIREKYLNIKRSDVAEFIKKQPIPQLTDVFKHRTNKPIVADFPNQIWCIDLIEMQSFETKNRGYKYILTVIDVFSRKIFLAATKSKDSAVIAKAMDKIIRRAGVSPKYIICDNGGEFKLDMETYCKAHEITIRRNRAYSPEANGIAERVNREIRKLLRDIHVENQNTNWIDNLQRVEDLHNETYTSAIDNIPNRIWTASKEPIAARQIPIYNETGDLKTQQIIANQTILKNVKKQIEEFKNDELAVGDRVRVRMDALSNSIKALVKSGHTKQIVVAFSPVVFQILKRIVPKNGMLERSKYVVGTPDGTKMLVNKEHGTKPRLFYSNALKKVSSDEKDYKDMSMEKAIQLSGVEITRNDVFSAPYNG